MIDKDWDLYLKFADDDYWDYHREEYEMFKKDLRRRASELSKATLNYFAVNWRLPYNPLYLELGGVDLAQSNPNLFNRMKTVLRKRGEGKICWGCSIEYKAGEISLAAHEHWSWDDAGHIRQLAAIRFLCKKCHYLSHHAFWMITYVPNEETVEKLELFCKVNECTFFEAHAHLESAFKLCNKRQKYEWKIDLSPISELIKEAELRKKLNNESSHGIKLQN